MDILPRFAAKRTFFPQTVLYYHFPPLSFRLTPIGRLYESVVSPYWFRFEAMPPAPPRGLKYGDRCAANAVSSLSSSVGSHGAGQGVRAHGPPGPERTLCRPWGKRPGAQSFRRLRDDRPRRPHPHASALQHQERPRWQRNGGGDGRGGAGHALRDPAAFQEGHFRPTAARAG